MPIDLKKLRHVVEVSRSEGITLAAQNLFITQSALTRSIADIESELNLKLFQRTPRGVLTTDAGKLFVSEAQQILDSFENLLSNLGGHRDLEAGHLRIAFASATFQQFISSSIKKLVHAYPGLNVSLIAGLGESLVPRLASGELDILFGTARNLGRWSELDVEVLKDLQCKIMIRHGHPLTKLKAITALDVLKYPAVQAASVERASSEIRGIYSKHGLPPRDPQYVCLDFEMLKGIVASSDAFSPVFSVSSDFGHLEKNFTLIDNTIEMPEQQLVLATFRNRANTPVVDVFAELVRAALNSDSH